MNGFVPMLRKEATEVRRTSRLYVLPAILVFCALTGSVLTYFLPVIIKAAASNSPGLSMQIPEQSMVNAMLEYWSELSQIALFALIIASAGIISGEVRSGAIVLVVTKPVSRAAFVLSKIGSQTAVVVASAVVGTLIFTLSAYPLYGTLPPLRLLAAIGAVAAVGDHVRLHDGPGE